MDAKLRAAVEGLLADHPERVPLDAIGDALGLTTDTTEIEAVLDALEAAGRTIVAPEGARGVAALRKVVPAARAIARRTGRTAKVVEIAAETGLAEPEVRQALLLARVMGR
ncbi:MAG: hypothetical protein HYV09_09500 [Deltaproteobacteria bacterium]|nr:hypothetical protein [Deltaproteobacteria bacterium]